MTKDYVHQMIEEAKQSCPSIESECQNCLKCTNYACEWHPLL